MGCRATPQMSGVYARFFNNQNMLFNSQYFTVQEFVPPEIYNLFGPERSTWFIQPEIVNVCHLLRVMTGRSVTVNNWHRGGPYRDSGYRMPSCKVGAEYSQHKLGNAADVKVAGMKPADVHAFINAHLSDFITAGLTTMEALAFTPSWTHLDCRGRIAGIHPVGGFLIVEPQ